ncbi:hypothetical protein [Roseomonas rosulenta]|uniref:hypothetical protein n=1 Tax=Roseomonas rosulenta TaxID=2748667 RepID=UPI0018DF8004|nr:hypothetical protein [Roseomonas rosulenta]
MVEHRFMDAADTAQGPSDQAGARRDGAAVPSRQLRRRGALAIAFALPACGAIQRGAARDRAALAGRERHAWVIRNARLGADWQETERAVLTIAGRAISSMIAHSGQNDVLRLQTQAERDRVDFNLAYIKDDFTLPWERPFDHAWMQALFEYGRQRALDGRAWDQTAPCLAGGRRPARGR